MRISLSIVLVLAIPGASAAQTSTNLDQIAPNAARTVDRVGADDVAAQRAPTPAVPQLSAPGASTAPPAQLSTGRPGPVTQLHQGVRTAEGPAPLSAPADGRTAMAATRIEGADRCDPALPESESDPRCAAVIENRSAEFARPDPTLLTPEQRLLAEQRLRPTGAMQAVRRAAGNISDLTSIEDQGVASVALKNAAPEPPPRKEEDPLTDPAAVEALGALVQFGADPRP